MNTIDDFFEKVDGHQFDFYRQRLEHQFYLSYTQVREMEEDYRNRKKFRENFDRPKDVYSEYARYFAGLEAYVAVHYREFPQS